MCVLPVKLKSDTKGQASYQTKCSFMTRKMKCSRSNLLWAKHLLSEYMKFMCLKRCNRRSEPWSPQSMPQEMPVMSLSIVSWQLLHCLICMFVCLYSFTEGPSELWLTRKWIWRAERLEVNEELKQSAGREFLVHFHHCRDTFWNFDSILLSVYVPVKRF